MQPPLVSETVDWLARTIGPEPDETIAEMDAFAAEADFPTVGPAVGGWLALLARAADAERAFEFGSGYGYSAYWVARELPADGEVVLTEIDREELDMAESYFERAGLADRARFEHGDALNVVERMDGEFDFVLLDHEMDRYVDAFEAVRDRMPSGGVVAADNAVTAGHIDPDDMRRILEGESVRDASDGTRGTAGYLDHLRTTDDFTSGLLPLGEGLSVSIKR
jgi:predicted O-methyltransferase YrrM